MRRKETYHYYVEGEDEKSLLDVLKSDLRCIESGKVDKFNVVQNKFTNARIRPLKTGTIVVLVYDTDVETNMDILQYNVDFLRKQSGIKDVISQKYETRKRRVSSFSLVLQLERGYNNIDIL